MRVSARLVQAAVRGLARIILNDLHNHQNSVQTRCMNDSKYILLLLLLVLHHERSRLFGCGDFDNENFEEILVLIERIS